MTHPLRERNQAIIEALAANPALTKAELSRRFGISRERVGQILTKFGPPQTPRKDRASARKAEILRRWKAGEDCRQIAEALHVKWPTIRECLARLGIPTAETRLRTRFQRKLRELEIQALALREKGYNYKDIARVQGCHLSTARDRVLAAERKAPIRGASAAPLGQST